MEEEKKEVKLFFVMTKPRIHVYILTPSLSSSIQGTLRTVGNALVFFQNTNKTFLLQYE